MVEKYSVYINMVVEVVEKSAVGGSCFFFALYWSGYLSAYRDSWQGSEAVPQVLGQHQPPPQDPQKLQEGCGCGLHRQLCHQRLGQGGGESGEQAQPKLKRREKHPLK